MSSVMVASARERGDAVALGFDGSRKRHDATTDATALVGCRVSDGHLFVPQHAGRDTIWEPPAPPGDRDWEVPAPEVDEAVRAVFDRYNVVAFYADPTLWEGWLAGWESDYGKLPVKASDKHPFHWWPGPKRQTEAVQRLHAAIAHGEVSHDGNVTLRAHVLNARSRENSYGITIAKEHPASRRKIDAAYAAVLAWQGRLDALSLPGR